VGKVKVVGEFLCGEWKVGEGMKVCMVNWGWGVLRW